MTTRKKCPFLATMWRRPGDKPISVCKAGVNFYSVGRGESLCQTCPVPGLVAEPVCEHLVVYTWLRAGESGHTHVEAMLDCCLPTPPSAGASHCEDCPLLQAKNGYPLTVDSLSPASSAP